MLPNAPALQPVPAAAAAEPLDNDIAADDGNIGDDDNDNGWAIQSDDDAAVVNRMDSMPFDTRFDSDSENDFFLADTWVEEDDGEIKVVRSTDDDAGIVRAAI